METQLASQEAGGHLQLLRFEFIGLNVHQNYGLPAFQTFAEKSSHMSHKSLLLNIVFFTIVVYVLYQAITFSHIY